MRDASSLTTLRRVSNPVKIPAADGPSDGKQVALLIDLAKDQVKEAYDVAQALESKARNLAQVSTVFFAASQTAVGIQVAVTATTSRPTWVAIVATVLGLAGLVAIAMAAFRTVGLQEPQDQMTVNIDTLTKKLVTFAERDDERVSRFMLGELGTVAKGRRTKNAAKVIALGKVQFWAYAALGSSSAALFFGLVVSYFYR